MAGDALRIALFSDSTLPILNGVAVSIDALVREMRNAGHSVHVYTAAFPGYRDPDPNTFRFPAFETPWSKGYPVATPPYYGMLHRFRKHAYDLIHTHTPGPIGLVGLRWAQSHEIPIVSTYHTLYDRYAHYIPLFPRRYVRHKIAKHTNFYYNRVDHVITPSAAALRWLRRHSVRTPASVIPTGAPPRAMHDRAETRSKLGIPAQQRMLLYVGRLAREKNLGLLFDMASLAFDQDPSLRLWLVGDGPYRGEATTMARRAGVGDRVHFVGEVARNEVDPYYAAADLFVFSSITETQGLVVQEAGTYGLPAVVVGGGGASAGVVDGQNGFVVRNEPREMAERVLEIFADEPLHARLSEGAVRLARQYGSEAMAEKVVAVYHRAMEARSRERVRENDIVLA
ncbi:MAG: glycosyltransferase [Fimbriimonadaceae bacterium]|nr:glycosyltransferase [Chthonomonadaceae bacterium]MCO5298263.1 glycosyltransferase [Fimbriimonadaceae bacterium]